MPDKHKIAHLQRTPTTDSHSSKFGEEAEEIEAHSAATATYDVSGTELRRAVANPRGASPQAILGLQARYGNQAIQRIVQRVGRQRGKAFYGIDKNRNEEEIIFARLRNKEFRVLFLNNSKNEFSLENLEGLLEIQDFRVSPNLPRARRIFNQYVAAGSPSELNLAASIRNQATTNLQQAIANGAADKTLFDKVIEGVMVNILDTWGRFQISQDYHDWVENHPQF